MQYNVVYQNLELICAEAEVKTGKKSPTKLIWGDERLINETE